MNRLAFLKKLKLSRREAVRLSLPVLALALVASVVTGRERPSETIAEPVARIDTRIQPAPDADLDLTALSRAGREEVAAARVDPFARPQFDEEHAAGHESGAGRKPARPSAPPLPFTYLGKVIEDGKLEVFLGRGEDSYSVKAGTRIGKEYRVDKVSETKVTFTYLPLKHKQVLDIPAVN
jgi:hypothetical protein